MPPAIWLRSAASVRPPHCGGAEHTGRQSGESTALQRTCSEEHAAATHTLEQEQTTIERTNTSRPTGRDRSGRSTSARHTSYTFRACGSRVPCLLRSFGFHLRSLAMPQSYLFHLLRMLRPPLHVEVHPIDSNDPHSNIVVGLPSKCVSASPVSFHFHSPLAPPMQIGLSSSFPQAPLALPSPTLDHVEFEHAYVTRQLMYDDGVSEFDADLFAIQPVGYGVEWCSSDEEQRQTQHQAYHHPGEDDPLREANEGVAGLHLSRVDSSESSCGSSSWLLEPHSLQSQRWSSPSSGHTVDHQMVDHHPPAHTEPHTSTSSDSQPVLVGSLSKYRLADSSLAPSSSAPSAASSSSHAADPPIGDFSYNPFLHAESRCSTPIPLPVGSQWLALSGQPRLHAHCVRHLERVEEAREAVMARVAHIAERDAVAQPHHAHALLDAIQSRFAAACVALAQVFLTRAKSQADEGECTEEITTDGGTTDAKNASTHTQEIERADSPPKLTDVATSEVASAATDESIGSITTGTETTNLTSAHSPSPSPFVLESRLRRFSESDCALSSPSDGEVHSAGAATSTSARTACAAPPPVRRVQSAAQFRVQSATSRRLDFDSAPLSGGGGAARVHALSAAALVAAAPNALSAMRFTARQAPTNAPLQEWFLANIEGASTAPAGGRPTFATQPRARIVSHLTSPSVLSRAAPLSIRSVPRSRGEDAAQSAHRPLLRAGLALGTPRRHHAAIVLRAQPESASPTRPSRVPCSSSLWPASFHLPPSRQLVNARMRTWKPLLKKLKADRVRTAAAAAAAEATSGGATGPAADDAHQLQPTKRVRTEREKKEHAHSDTHVVARD